jgi:hypothetical protein
MGFETNPPPGRPALLDCLRAAIQLHKAGGRVEAVRSGDDNDREAAQRSSLLKLAKSAIELHAVSLARDVLPRTDDGHSKPLIVALTALNTIRKREGV